MNLFCNQDRLQSDENRPDWWTLSAAQPDSELNRGAHSALAARLSFLIKFLYKASGKTFGYFIQSVTQVLPSSKPTSSNEQNLHKQHPKSSEKTETASCLILHIYLFRFPGSQSFSTNTVPRLESETSKNTFQTYKPAALEPMIQWHQDPKGEAALKFNIWQKHT